ncbi:hypothetical protein [Paraherbaspirillum soli]|uniref:Uncharacterized protein n=1 Tax=Paraherbaspirillum soli TaxID=631222 RepID=A0ABW0M8Y8_9BURK
MDLLPAIEDAFAWRVRPDVLTDSKQLSDAELDDVLAISRLDWREVTSEKWEQYFDVICWLSPLAFCFYLPGIFKATIDDNEPNLIVVGSIVSMLDRSPKPEWWDDFFLPRWTLLTEPECRVTQEWILWLSNFGNAALSDDALERSLQTLELLISKRGKK